MASQPQNSQDVNATETEKQPNIQGARKHDKAEAAVTEKETPERESVPGWTLLQTMKMRGLKGRGSGSVASAPSAVSRNVGNGKSVDGNPNDELKATQTNGSGDGQVAVGEVEALHEVRSDDELLGDEEGGSEPQPVTARTYDGNNGGEGVERTASGGEYRVYRSRWFGLVQLVLLNIIVSWDVSCRPVQPASACHC
jgi:FLVCR family MFS transporter 7